MDVSQSMADDLKNIQDMGRKLAKALKRKTKSLRMGFGSFVDKPIMPFASEYKIPGHLKNEHRSGRKYKRGNESRNGSTNKSRNTSRNKSMNNVSKTNKYRMLTRAFSKYRKNPCSRLYNNVFCEPTYTFKNAFSLSENIEGFIKSVRKVKHSTNYDAPEGGLEAMMQAIVCTEKIGWNLESTESSNQSTSKPSKPQTKNSPESIRHSRISTKFILYASDSSFHTAGDGKLANIIIPNDMQCHLNKRGVYTHALEQDYPSLGQVRKMLKKHGIQPVFAVTKYNVDSYSWFENVSFMVEIR